MNDTREHALQLIDRLPETQLSALSDARDWLKHNGGKGIAHADAMRRLGLE